MAPGQRYFIEKLDLRTGRMYDTQRRAILERLRTKWPTRFDLKKTDEVKLEVVECIKPLVLAFLSERNLRSQEVENLLVTYAEWAFKLNDWSRDEMKKTERSLDLDDAYNEGLGDESDRDDNIQHHQRVATIDDPKSSEDRLNVFTGSPRRDTLRRSTLARRPGVDATSAAPKNGPDTMNTTSQIVPWDDVELAVDATVLGLGVIWLPLIQLKPVKGKDCHWSDFTFAKLMSSLEEELGAEINTGACEFVYGDIKFTNPGAWNIVLKRFGETAHGQGNILRLNVQLKEQAHATITTRGSENGVDSTSSGSREGRSKRARSSFEGATSDFSEDSDEASKGQLAAREMSQSSLKRTRASVPGHGG